MACKGKGGKSSKGCKTKKSGGCKKVIIRGRNNYA